MLTALSTNALVTSWLQGFGLGAGLIVAIGAQNAFVLRQGLERRNVFATAAVCTGCDMALIALGVGGMGGILARLPALSAAATWGGAAFLLLYGLRSFRAARAPGSLVAENGGRPPSLRGTLFAAAGFSLLNPHVYLDTVVLLGSVGARFPAGQRSAFAAGAMSASTVWFFGLAYGAARLAPLFQRPAAWRALDVAVGGTMWAIALSLLGVPLAPILGAATLLAALLALVGLAYQAAGSARDARRFPPPGHLIRVSGRRLHIRVQGQGSPTVILESGIASTSLSWSLVVPRVAAFTRVCVYDRAGLGWSDPPPGPVAAGQMADDLHALLAAAGVPGPYVLAGHSFGGLLARLYAAKYSNEMAGLLLVDPVAVSDWLPLSPEQDERLRRGVMLSRRGAMLARLGVVRFALAWLGRGHQAVPRWLARVSAGRGAGVTNRLTAEAAKLPREAWPPIMAHWSRPGSFEAMARHLECLPACAAAARDAGPPRDIPLIVLSAGELTARHLQDHEAAAQLSSQGRHIRIPASGHWIQLDAPEQVAEAIREVVERARAMKLVSS